MIDEGGNRLRIVQRFTYPRNCHPLRLDPASSRRLKLQEQFIQRKVTSPTTETRGTKGATKCASGLAGDAKGAAAIPDRLYRQAVNQGDEEFLVTELLQ